MDRYPESEDLAVTATRKHQSPSRRRYAAEHPTIGVHVDRPTHQRLIELRERSGLSLGQLVRRALGEIEEELDGVASRALQQGIDEGRRDGYSQGRAAGYAEARDAFRLTFPCAICRLPVVIPPGSGVARDAAAFLHARHAGHAKCHQT